MTQSGAEAVLTFLLCCLLVVQHPSDMPQTYTMLLLPADTPAEDITAVMYDVFDFIQVPLPQPCTSETLAACAAPRGSLQAVMLSIQWLHGRFTCSEQGAWLTQAVGRVPDSPCTLSPADDPCC